MKMCHICTTKYVFVSELLALQHTLVCVSQFSAFLLLLYAGVLGRFQTCIFTKSCATVCIVNIFESLATEFDIAVSLWSERQTPDLETWI